MSIELVVLLILAGIAAVTIMFLVSVLSAPTPNFYTPAQYKRFMKSCKKTFN